MFRIATSSNETGQCLRRRMKATGQRSIMLLDPAMNAQQDAGQSFCGKVLIFPVRHSRAHRLGNRILDLDSHRGTGKRQLRIVGGQNGHASQPTAFEQHPVIEINPAGLPNLS
jgi:hypothetical protein